MLHYTHSNANRCAIIAGNGPSLKEIDYTRLPPPPPYVVVILVLI
ncbi:MAG: hypothetical protein PUG77_05345 [Helicobacter bilis]|nr:hypothetical protein [Helicobacter bilis]MDD7296696.1 hypothetical protein [Helicobacter bilis]